jgi:hypothetical protein
MVPKNVFAATLCATLLAWSGASFAADYQPGDFLKLDLSTALLSPKPLGPTTQFAPFPIEAASGAAQPAAQAQAEPKDVPAAVARKIRTARIHVEKPLRAEKPRGAARTRLAHRHGNPLNAEAMDRRIQVWPCKSGGICDWQRR